MSKQISAFQFTNFQEPTIDFPIITDIKKQITKLYSIEEDFSYYYDLNHEEIMDHNLEQLYNLVDQLDPSDLEDLTSQLLQDLQYFNAI